MKIVCEHGFYKFYPSSRSEVYDWNTLFPDNKIFHERDYYTFEALLEAPDYSIAGLPFMGIVALATVEGRIEDIFRENGFCYDFLIDGVSLILSKAIPALGITFSRDCGVASFLLQAGAVVKLRPTTGFVCFWNFDNRQFYHSEFFYD